MAAPLPPTRDLVFYGGLGALAVAGALDWPVALAIGGAALVVHGGQRAAPERHEEQPAGSEPTPAGHRRSPAG
ncbi:hypothetical protein NKH77_54295 [Streptomyces sp. M19]